MANGQYRYARLQTQFWTHQTIKNMSRAARELYWYLMSSPYSNMAGLYYLPWAFAHHHLKFMPYDELQGAVRYLMEQGRIMYDDDAEMVLLMDHLQHNPPDNPKVAEGMVNTVRELPPNKLIGPWLAMAHKHCPKYATVWERFRNSLPNRIETVYQTLSNSDSDSVSDSGSATELASGAAAPNERPDVGAVSDVEVAAALDEAKGKKWTDEEKALVDLIWQWLKKQDALPASAATVGGKPGRFFGSQMTQAKRLLAIRPIEEWCACFKWATEESDYWPAHLTTLGQLGDKVWPQFARANGHGGGNGGGPGRRNGSDHSKGGGRSRFVERS